MTILLLAFPLAEIPMGERTRRSLRLLTLNFRNAVSRRSLTVSGEMFKRAAIWRLV